MKTSILTFLLAAAVSVPAQTRPAITGIAFARFYTTNPTATADFYGKTLGFDRIESHGEWLYPVNHAQWIEIDPSTPPRPDCRMEAIAFTTRDAAALQRYLTARGVPIAEPLHASQFAVRDPEANLVIFVQSGSERAVAKAPASPRATSHRIIHAGFIVHDRAREAAFWIDILGFRPYWFGGQTDARTDYVSLQVPNGSDWLEFMLNSKPDPGLRQTGVMDHFSLGVAHMSDAIATLASNHCEGENCTKTQIGRDGKVQLNLFDPDQTRIEFMEFIPTKEPCCSPFTGKHPGPEEDQ